MTWEDILKNDKEVEKFLSRGRRPFDMQARKDTVTELQDIRSERNKDLFYKNPKLPRLISKNLRTQMKADPQRDKYGNDGRFGLPRNVSKPTKEYVWCREGRC